MSKTFVVTGTGHSGTKWAARFFNALGYDCGHEKYLRYDEYQGLPSSDSSWMALGHLHHLIDVPMVHLVRDPIAVVQSLMRTAAYRDTENATRHNAYTYEFLVGMHDTDELGRCILRTTQWDDLLDHRPDTLRVRIEDMHLGQKEAIRTAAKMVHHATGDIPLRDNVREALAELGTDLNPHARHIEVDASWSDVMNHPLGYMLADRAKRYGYEIGT